MKLHIIQCCPDDLRFYWETFVQLNNAKELGVSDKFRILVYTPPDREPNGVNPKWKELEAVFPEVGFYFYFDRAHVMEDIKVSNYVSLLRPYLLARHFKEHPELEKDAIFYIDGDVLFTKPLDWLDKYLDDDINYLSDTKSYLNSEYFDSKVNDVLPNKLEEYKKIDVLDMLCKPFGINRQICEENKNNTGGAQSLLKNVDYQFWQDVYSGSLFIRTFLLRINANFFESENKGFQSWCADMWSLLFNLWSRDRKTLTPKDFDFAWATDEYKRLENINIFHNAGITNSQKLKSSQPDDRKNTRIEVDCPAFYKSKKEYANNELTPFEDVVYVQEVIDNPISKSFCTHFYAEEIIKTKNKYKL